MRVVVQRVSRGQVSIDGEVTGAIGVGLVALLGVHVDDDEKAVRFCAEKCVNLRVFADSKGRMNRSLLEVSGEVLAVSQFTLLGECRQGRRPSFVSAAPPERAQLLYEQFIAIVESHGVVVERGVFGAMMKVEIDNDGPVTLIIEDPPK